MNTALQNELSQLRELVAGLRGTLAEVKTENQLLRQKLEFFIKRYFGGTKNESLDPKQLELLLAGLGALSAPAPAAEKPVAPVRALVAARPARQALPAPPPQSHAEAAHKGNRDPKPRRKHHGVQHQSAP